MRNTNNKTKLFSHKPQNVSGWEQTGNSDKTAMGVTSAEKGTQGRNKATYHGPENRELQDSQ